ncbi:hypothetical protein HZH66_009409 [Vespula vulgaris]|uniref:Uncharacterized protein n=1 Tax=Vespula vulgaris TaxID=7454 RepID=A0A834JQ89_VESVU|nr:hypothetical protein HZH66_009409 [Vespula vulgaris]
MFSQVDCQQVFTSLSFPLKLSLIIRYSSLPRSCHSAGLDGTGMSEGGTGVPLSSPYCPDNTLPLLETVSEDQEIHARRNNAIDEKNTHRIVIGSEELVGRDIDNVVRQRINALEKSPKVVRSTALIIKTSKVPAVKPSLASVSFSSSSSLLSPTSTTSITPIIAATTTITTPITTRTTTTATTTSLTLKKHVSNGSVSTTKTKRNVDVPDGTAINSIRDDFCQVRKVQSQYDCNTETTIRDSKKITKTATTSISNFNSKGSTTTTNGCVYYDHRQSSQDDDRNGIDSILKSVGQHEGEANDYYFRDSFDHSSSESQLLDASGKPHSRSVTPVPKMQKLQNSKLCLQQKHQHQHQHQQQQQHHQQQLQQQQSHLARRFQGKLRHRSLRILRRFVPAFMLALTVFFISLVLIFETDATIFNSLRKTPEMVALRNQYYVPLKEFLRTNFSSVPSRRFRVTELRACVGTITMITMIMNDDDDDHDDDNNDDNDQKNSLHDDDDCDDKTSTQEEFVVKIQVFFFASFIYDFPTKSSLIVRSYFVNLENVKVRDKWNDRKSFDPVPS